MQTLPTTRLFTLREANALVPMLQRTFTKARELRDQLVQAHKSGDAVRAGELEDRLQATLAEVTQLGIEVKAGDGLCDFRSKLAGRVVYLCWRFDEARIEHFHELRAGFAGRKPLPEGAVFEGELLH